MNSSAFPNLIFVRFRIYCIITVLLVPVFCRNLAAQRQGPFAPVPPKPKATVPADSQQGKGVLKMKVEEGKLTADITDTPFQTVLRELAERTGIIFEIRTQNNPPVSIHLQQVSLEESIRRIASGNNTIFQYSEDAASGFPQLVRIYPRTPQVQQPSILYLGTGAVTKTNNTVETPEQALQVLSSNASVEDRELGIEILVKSKGDAAVKALMNCVADPAPEIRVAAIEGLATMGAREALPGILKSLKDEHPGVRQSASTAVALLGDAKNIKDLRPLTFDKDVSVAGAAEVAIRKLSASIKR